MSGFDSTRVSLLLRLRNRTDQLSWQAFHQRYGELLFRYARKRGASATDAEDIVQDVEMYLFKAMEGFEYDAGKGRFRSYLRSAVIHAMGRRAAREAKQGTPLDPHSFDHLAARTDADNDAQWEHEWRMHRLRWALRSIAGEFEETTLQAFQLHVLAGRPVTETADEVGISKASVYQAKSRVLKRLRNCLQTLDPNNDV
ncbi:MAG TPA: sigma-70 family RNA polymerase sigma factor [Phycisphaerae bacterium]|nr:sigma-70 family RNA polymerase sigma factor [Phycisphaerae bacterium]